MSPSLHKLLRHGYEIAELFPLPAAFFAEDASESWHRLYRINLIHHARQCSRKARILDAFMRGVYMSDPYLSLILIDERLKKQKETEEPKNVKQFFLE